MAIGAETFVSPALQPVFDLIFSEGVKLFVKLSGGELDKTLEKWESELMMINGLLDDAGNKQIQSKAVQSWLEELQDLAFDMEDILSDFEIQAQKHEFNLNSADQQDDDEDGGVGQGCINPFKKMTMVARTTVSDCLSTLYNAISQVAQSKIEGINTRLHRIQSHAQLLHLCVANNTQQQQTHETETRRRETSSLEVESNVFARDEGKQKIITRLLEDDDDSSNESYVVIPIVGIGGIGKTTLAQWVYNNEKVKAHFGLMAWVCVSDVFDVKRITITIVNEATTNGTLDKSSSLNAAQTQLMQILLGKKFLIVLDDVWNCTNDGWQSLNTPFKHAAKGSRVIMTTRNDRDARTMIHCPTPDTIIRLKGLSKDDCWNLFQQHANNDSDLDEMRDDIVKKCKGLPLAAKALGGLFKKSLDESECRMILGSNMWSEDIGILPVLRLSYDYLPSELKCVFAYCSLFPKDYGFGKMEVILLWMAQGFLPNDEHMEALGNKYFNDLESRSLIEQSPYYLGRETFVMHDLIHDLALWAARGICYARGTKNMTKVDRERIRHVFLTVDATTLQSQLKLSHLRTVYDNGVITNLEFIQSLSYVRTLRLESDTIKVLPKCIRNLKHLRFLSLKFKSITELPESINCLWNLQTLELYSCENLKKVPYIGSLKKLRHLVIDLFQVELPRGFEKLTNLKSLEYFELADGYGSRIKELKNLNNLQGKLRIFGLENVSKVEDAKKAQLHQKKGLDKLHLEWGTICEEQVDYNTIRDVLEQLKPPISTKECKLDGYMGLIFPAWLGDPSFNNIVTILLFRCRKCEELPSLGQLPCLKRLVIQDMDSIKRIHFEYYGCSNPFPSLESLIIKDLKCWEKWEHIAVDSNNNRAFPCLQSLEIHDCGSLQGDLPPSLPSLKTLEINSCRELSVSLSLPNLPLLEILKVDDCKSVSITTEDVKQGVSEEGNTPSELVHLHLSQLSIWNCPGLVSLPEHLLLPALKHLWIYECEKLESMPSEMLKYTSLQSLFICKCPGGGLPENLKELYINGDIKGVQQLGLHRLHSLEKLVLKLGDVETEDDLNLSLPSSSLKKVRISGIHNLKNLSVVDGTNLNRLVIENCKKLESLEVANFTCPSSTLILRSCPKLESVSSLFPTSISELQLFDLGSSADAIEQIPGLNLDLPSSLRELRIGGFQNLKTITCSTLPKLWWLVIKHCPKFESFGETALPSHLLRVEIEECELIKPHLLRDPHHGVIRMDGERYSLCCGTTHH